MKKLMIFTLSIALVACERNRSGAEEAVLAVLKDPESARFGEFYFNSETNKGCLAVNAKNTMGGYTGEQRAYIKRTESGWESNGTTEASLEFCSKYYADSKD